MHFVHFVHLAMYSAFSRLELIILLQQELCLCLTIKKL